MMLEVPVSPQPCVLQNPPSQHSTQVAMSVDDTCMIVDSKHTYDGMLQLSKLIDE